MIRRRTFLGSLAGAAAVAAAPRPNILFIYTDDQRWDAMSCAGHPFLKTPNMDRLAREGALMRNAFVSTPLCSPSRSSFLTGQYVHTTGITDNTDRGAQSHKLVTFPMLLQKAGYRTGYIGKWHMGNDDNARPGFDHWVSFRGQGQYVNPEININGERGKREGYMTDLLSRYAADFIRGKHASPWVLCLGHKACHGPFTPAERHAKLYADQPIERAPNSLDTGEDKPGLAGFRKAPPRGEQKIGGPNDETIRNQVRTLLAVDEGLGEILRALEETGQLDNTFIVYTSDNGYFWGEHGLGDKRRAYEESIRIPMLVRYPRLARAGSTPSAMVMNIDVAPTALELAGVRAPANMHGRSMLPVLKNPGAKGRNAILTEYFVDPPFPATPKWQSVRTPRWKYIHHPELQGADELYDLAADRFEMKNLARDSASAPVMRKMQSALRDLLRRTTP